MNIKEKSKILKKKISVVYLAIKNKETPILAKIVCVITVVYALSPIDLIPDFIPVLGYLDDLIILPLLILLSIRLIPDDVMKMCETKAEDLWRNGKPKRWYYAIPVILIWISIIWIILLKFL